MKSWLKSMLESSIDVGSGFFVALLVQLTIIPFLFNVEFTGIQNVGIVLTFTVVSIIRSTLWRKFFKFRYKTKAQLEILKTGYCKFCNRGRKKK